MKMQIDLELKKKEHKFLKCRVIIEKNKNKGLSGQG